MYFLIGLGIIVIIVYGFMIESRQRRIKIRQMSRSLQVQRITILLSKRRRKVRRLKSIGRRRIRINPGAWSKQQRMLLFQAQR